MKVWVHLDGVQQGPFEMEDLPTDRIKADTPVWHSGLPDWVPAKDSPAVWGAVTAEATRFRTMDTGVAQSLAKAEAAGRAMQEAERARAIREAAAEQGPATTYLWFSVILTVLTFNLVGIVPIVLGWCVRNCNRKGQYVAAASVSRTTAWWVMITVVVSLMIPFTMLL